MNGNFEKASQDLVYYFRLLAKKSGVNWDSDNDAEVSFIIENIFDGMIEEIEERIDSHNDAKVSHMV